MNENILGNLKNDTYGQCRCCLSEGDHRDVYKEYSWNGIKEIYADIFLECFNLFLPTNMNMSTLICYTCVERLREASSFKMMVLSTEQQLAKALDGDKPVMLVNVPVIEDTLDRTIGFKIELNDVNPLNEQIDEQHVEGPSPLHLKNKLNNKELEHEQSKESVPKSQRTPKTNQVTYMTEKKALIANVSTVLECSNVTPFKSKMRAGYPCFYCRNIFDNFQSLRTHQNEEHTKSNLRNLLKAYSAESLVVYADVTDLKCTLCDQNIINLQELKQHLTKYHDKRFYKKFTDRIVPFKFLENNYFECQICSLNLETFGAIERHMNTHYRNYACEECGAGFVTMLRLKTHMHSIHKEGHFPCNLCDKVFTTQQRYKGHVDFVHKMLKKLKCQKCPERFSDYFVQQKHLVEVHGETPIVYKCNVCDRSFNRRYTLSCHMKRRHLEQKDVECDLCSYACYNKTELRDHMLKHYMERSFQCSMCKKAYSRKKSLREHIIRIHANDKKFECKLCGQRFVHNCSLKAHIRNLHETE